MDIGSLLTSSLTTSNASSSTQNPLSNVDTDGDGLFSLEEFTAGAPEGVSSAQATEVFESGDTNEDGYLSEDELAAMRPPPPPQGGTGANAQMDDDMLSMLIQLMDSAETLAESDNSVTEDETATIATSDGVSSTSSGSVMSGEELFAYMQERRAASSQENPPAAGQGFSGGSAAQLGGFGLL